MKVTVYTKPDCAQCEWTKKQLDRNEVTYNTVDVTTDDAAMQFIQQYADDQGRITMPVVVVENGARTGSWCGFKLDRIRGLKDTGRY